ncbi:hypothetical protein B0T16DRAFT_219088 [Cercophora newfieldiana]|uniref:Uncharacterized protein n=1 Tax=Cercophora newfieldiana TaxID=92897 RepID=A0AA39XY34_9PEZI|nr:hypothetical protein B0T16DRAFT_219088 [Cercophora newfieldiana]
MATAFLRLTTSSFKMISTTLLLSVLLSLAAAAPPLESAPDAAPHCNDDCLLKLIRYREEANVDWLMALPYCSIILDSPAAARIRVQPLTAPIPDDTPISTSPVDTTTEDITTTITTTITSTATTSTTTTLDYLQRRLDGSQDRDRNRCERYRARERPQPSPWKGQSEGEIRKACLRILHRVEGKVQVAPAPAKTVFVKPVAVSVSTAVVGGGTELVTLTVYMTITAGLGWM